MKIVEINTVFNGSTGKIMRAVASLVQQKNMEAYCYAGYSTVRADDQCYNIGTKRSPYIHSKLSYVFGNPEMHSTIETKKLIRQLESINPDIIHLHNLHGFYLNVPDLFDYIKKNNIKVVWTLHDCWSFTGRCPHFQITGCDKWRNGCYKCPMPREEYPPTVFDSTKKMWNRKKSWFTDVDDLTVVTPSNWLAGLVKDSFLRDYPVEVINNGVNLSVFKPTSSNFREKYHLLDKKIILGVAFGWGYKKGLDTILELSKVLSDDFRIVLVGTDDSVDKELPGNILLIHRTNNQIELAEIYSAADILFNPTREDTFPTVNMEAIVCGTPVITFDVCGSPETIAPGCGIVLNNRDIQDVQNAISIVLADYETYQKNCLNETQRYDEEKCFEKYIELYKSIQARG